MHFRSLRPRRVPPCWIMGLLLVSALWFLSGLSDLSTAQTPPKKLPQEEEEEKVVPPKPRPRIEEEEEDNKPKRKVIKIDEDDPTPKPAAKPAEDQSTNLLVAARQTKNPELQEFYRQVAIPHDVVTTRSRGHYIPIEPIPYYYPERDPRIRGVIRMQPFDVEWKHTRSFEGSGTQFERIEAFEDLVRQHTTEFLKKNLDQLGPKDKRYLSRLGMLTAARKALVAALDFHQSARAREIRIGQAWEGVGNSLRKYLFNVELDQLKEFERAKDWDGALASANRLAEAYSQPEDRELIAQPLARMIMNALQQGEGVSDAQMRLARQHLQIILQQFPNSQATQPITEALRRYAQMLFEQAAEFEKTDPKKAIELLQRAEEFWPRLPGLAEKRRQLGEAYPFLRVGVRNLPQLLAPGLACTDSEHQAVELLFESLMRLVELPGQGQRYEPVLARSRPQLITLGRHFPLVRDAYWSNDQPVIAPDIKATVRLRKNPNWPGYTAAWAELVDGAQMFGDPFQVSLTLHQGFLDPLELMTFKILPQSVRLQDYRKFAQEPTGSGPFKYQGRKRSSDGREYALFLANPNYGSRSNRTGLPRIREIQFFAYDDYQQAVEDMKNSKLDLLGGLPSDKIKELRAVSQVTVPPPQRNRRIYFLAINHRKPVLQSSELRRAIGYAINREKLLDGFFRADLGKEVHRALNGPFPAESWACDPHQPSLDDTTKARLYSQQLAGKGHDRFGKLSLKYDKEDPVAARALQALCDQVRKEISVEIELEALEPHRLHQAVEITHDYQLAYYHYDYPSDGYWLWPLFDSQALVSGGSNYLGYTNSQLVSLFRQALSHRDFGPVQETTRTIHGFLVAQMPLIPLWQLDSHIALHKDLKTTILDPLLIFSDIEHWTMERK